MCFALKRYNKNNKKQQQEKYVNIKSLSYTGIENRTGTTVWCVTSLPPSQLNVSIVVNLTEKRESKAFISFKGHALKQKQTNPLSAKTFFKVVVFLIFKPCMDTNILQFLVFTGVEITA